MRNKKSLLLMLTIMAVAAFLSADVLAQTGATGPPFAPPKTLKQELGDKIFTDVEFSQPPVALGGLPVSCETCHEAAIFWADPRLTPTSQGSLPGSIGGRNAPQLSYVGFIPIRHIDPVKGLVGGLFWDGRTIDLQTQANQPMLNPIEINATKASIAARVAAAPYRAHFEHVYGKITPKMVKQPAGQEWIFSKVGDALAHYMSQYEFHNFLSKFDASLLPGGAVLTPSETNGLALFNTHCASCHPSTPNADTGQILFTEFTYHNLGLPANAPLSPAGGDLGLAEPFPAATNRGKFKAPTVRNIEFTGPYGHNGVFLTIDDFLAFLNDRAAFVPDVADNLVNPLLTPGQLGNLGLTANDLLDLKNFLFTLTDGFIILQ